VIPRREFSARSLCSDTWFSGDVAAIPLTIVQRWRLKGRRWHDGFYRRLVQYRGLRLPWAMAITFTSSSLTV
jgi:hypothetical protein